MRKIPFIIIAFILFFIPFFWFKPGEINLGGDSSRLYFYDPLNYLKSFPLYGIAPSQTGEEMISYFFIPFVIFLLILKLIFQSPHVLINVFHGMMLTTGFVSVYLIISELIKNAGGKGIIKEGAAIIGGLFYSLTPVIGFNWDKSLVTHNQVFLNPLIFYLVLRSVLTGNRLFLIISVLITFIFSPNFSFIAAPAFFAFYPVSLLFIFLYAKAISSIKISLKSVLIGLFLFLLLHAYHLIPQLVTMFDVTSNLNFRVFSHGELSQGRNQFLSALPNIKLIKNILAIPQLERPFIPFDFIFFIFPLIVTLAGIVIVRKEKNWNIQRKTYILLLLFFLVGFFFASGKITELGVTLYASFFSLPGFNMFRNFYGQFMYVFFFSYALIIGFSFYFLVSSLGKIRSIVGTAFISIAICIYGWPFINGSMVNLPIYQSNNIKVPFKMDPEFEKVLDFIQKDRTDGKYLILPLTDFGYQMLAGTEGGMYIGPSAVGYLAGKNDFPGYVGFTPFADLFLKLAIEKDYTALKNILSIYNIKYIFYNEDPYIYNNFPKFPYESIRKAFPTQESYREFINNLDVDEKIRIGKYHIYSIQEQGYLPHFYVPRKTIPAASVEEFKLILPTHSFATDRLVTDNSLSERILLKADKIDVYRRIIKDYPLPVQYPFARWRLNSPIYPLIMIKEGFISDKYKKASQDSYIDSLLFFSAKRISELGKWEGGISVSKDVTSVNQLLKYRLKPKIFGITLFKDYNTWEACLSRYIKGIDEVITLVNTTDRELFWKIEKKSQINEALSNHQLITNLIIKNSRKNSLEKKYLQDLTDKLFSHYLNKVKIDTYDPSVVEYVITKPSKKPETYRMLFQNSKDNTVDFLKSDLNINSVNLKPIGISTSDLWIKLDGVNLNDDETFFTLHTSNKSIIENAHWEKSNNVSISTSSLLVTLESFVSNNKLSDGFFKTINNFEKDSHYLISFEYLTHGDIFETSLLFRYKDKRNVPESSYRYLFQEPKISRKWQKFNAIIETSNIHDMIFFITPWEKNTKRVKIDIKDFKMLKLPPHPEVFFLNAKSIQLSEHTPKITFKKINPTKYIISVQNAKTPYILVFSEAFNASWKLYLRNNSSNEKINIVKKYFNGDVNEGENESQFLNTNTFETWGRKSIADNRHFLANGYANGWHITPEDTSNTSDYDLIVEMADQRFFHYSVILTLGGIITILGWFTWIGIQYMGRQKWKKH